MAERLDWLPTVAGSASAPSGWLPGLAGPWSWSDAGFLLRSGLEILILWAVIYVLLLSLERISAGGKIKGISLTLLGVVAAWVASRWLQLHAISWLLQALIGFSALILVVVFQPELRRLFTRLGGVFPHHDQAGAADQTAAIVEALLYMASRRIGALVVIERNDRLEDWVRTSPFDCELSAKSLITLFWKDSPLHDGAVVVRTGRIAGAGVILPLTDSPEFKDLSGTRHRAAIGISEDTDALALVVSEETGGISMADRGRLTRSLSRQDLEILLSRTFRAATAKAGAA